MLRPTDFFQHLAALGKLDLLLGQADAEILPQF